MKKIKDSIGFDIGTSKIRLYKQGKQVIETPTILKFEKSLVNDLVVNGKISDFNALKMLLRTEIKKIQKPRFKFYAPAFSALISVSSDTNEVALRAFRDAIQFTGATKSFMLQDCFFAATGLDIDIKNSTSMIVDCGAGKTSITTIQGYKIVKNNIYDTAGKSFDEAIQTYISKQYNLRINIKTAEKIKIELVDFRKDSSNNQMQISGKDKTTSINKDIFIESVEINNSLKKDIDTIIDRIDRQLEYLSNTDSDKIKKNGIFLIGGGFKIKGLIDLIAEKLSVAPKSYNQDCDYMRIGFEKVQSNPDELFNCIMK